MQNAQLNIVLTTDIESYNRKGLGQNIGMPDMIIVVKGDVVIIENKLGAAEGNMQTERYYTKHARKVMNEQFKLFEVFNARAYW